MPIQLKEDDINELFSVVKDKLSYSDRDKFKEITLDFFNNTDYQEELEPLIGYQVKLEVDGNHKHDGQDVEYTMVLKSPSGEETELITEMNLVASWNYDGDEEIA